MAARKASRRERVRDPERSRERILAEATAQFVAKGFDGARVDEIAKKCGLSKNLMYHYYGSKVDLFVTVLERMYETIRHHQDSFEVDFNEPERALRELVAQSFSVFSKRQEFIWLLNEANLHKAVHIKNSARIKSLYAPLIKKITSILEHGVAQGVFRPNIDPLRLYVALASLSYHYIANRYTLKVAIGVDLAAGKNRDEWLDEITAIILAHCASRSASSTQ